MTDNTVLFSDSLKDPHLASPAVLAFVGDAYYSLLVRTHIANMNCSSKELHSLSVGFVSAPRQADAYQAISSCLTDEEAAVFRRGRNFHTGNVPKNSTRAQYHTATGLEALFGFLYLSQSFERANELFSIAISAL